MIRAPQGRSGLLMIYDQGIFKQPILHAEASSRAYEVKTSSRAYEVANHLRMDEPRFLRFGVQARACRLAVTVSYTGWPFHPIW